MIVRIAKLTKRIVDTAQPEPERYVVWDSTLKGFGLRVEPSGTKTFLVRYRIAGRKRFLAVGRFGHFDFGAGEGARAGNSCRCASRP